MKGMAIRIIILLKGYTRLKLGSCLEGLMQAGHLELTMHLSATKVVRIFSERSCDICSALKKEVAGAGIHIVISNVVHIHSLTPRD